MSKREKRYVPQYIEQAVFRLSEDHDLARRVNNLIPDASWRAGVNLTNADEERRLEVIHRLKEQERKAKAAHE
jgi:hypothetical protein